MCNTESLISETEEREGLERREISRIERAREMERIGVLREHNGSVVRECKRSGELKRVRRF